jgi:hypothetical protein
MNEIVHVCWGKYFVASVWRTRLLMAAIFIDKVNRLFLPILEEAVAEPKPS